MQSRMKADYRTSTLVPCSPSTTTVSSVKRLVGFVTRWRGSPAGLPLGTHARVLPFAGSSKKAFQRYLKENSAGYRIYWLNSASKQQGKAMKQSLSDIAPVLTVRDLSNYLKVHPSTIYRLLKTRQLPAFKVGSDWRFNVEEIDHWRVEREKKLVM